MVRMKRVLVGKRPGRLLALGQESLSLSLSSKGSITGNNSSWCSYRMMVKMVMMTISEDDYDDRNED